MAKIPFSIKYRPQIESGEYKVKIRDGRPARIICWEAKGCQPIIVLIRSAVNAEEEIVLQLYADGRFSSHGVETLYDLFIVTPEEELSEFEHRLCEFVSYIMNLVWYNKGLKLTNEQIIKGWKEDLLALARKELEPEIKAEALKDLPRWKKFAPNINDPLSEQQICAELKNSVMRVDDGGYCWIISREELNKLPKEDESHE